MYIKKKLKRRRENILNQLLRYAVVGGIAAIVDIGSFTIFSSYLGINYKIAILLSFSLGTLTNFAICNAFVFSRNSLPIWLVCIRHYISSIGGLIINGLVMMFIVDVLNFKHLLYAKVIGTASAFLSNFLMIKFFAFNNQVKTSNRERGKR
jgi:putative flippase GtrA